MCNKDCFNCSYPDCVRPLQQDYNEYKREYLKDSNNAEKNRKYYKRYRQGNLEKERARSRAYYEQHKAEKREAYQRWYKANRDKKREYDRLRYEQRRQHENI